MSTHSSVGMRHIDSGAKAWIRLVALESVFGATQFRAQVGLGWPVQDGTGVWMDVKDDELSALQDGVGYLREVAAERLSDREASQLAIQAMKELNAWLVAVEAGRVPLDPGDGPPMERTKVLFEQKGKVRVEIEVILTAEGWKTRHSFQFFTGSQSGTGRPWGDPHPARAAALRAELLAANKWASKDSVVSASQRTAARAVQKWAQQQLDALDEWYPEPGAEGTLTTETPAAPTAAIEPERAGGTSPMPPTTPATQEANPKGEVVHRVPVKNVHPSPVNPRKDLGDIGELTESVRSQGVLQPLVAIPVTADHVEIVMGHRRYAAAVAAGLSEVPVLIRSMGPKERLLAMLAENIHRNALTPLEEAEGFRRLEGMGVKQRDIAKRMGCSQSHISKRLGLLQLPERARELLDSQGISVKEAEKLSGVKDSKLVEQIVRRGVEPHVVEKALRDQAQTEARARTRAELEKAGVQVHSENKGPSSWYPVQGGPKPLKGGGARSGTWAELPIEVDAHILQPCHAAVIDFDGHPVYICTKPKNHPEAAPKPIEQPALFKETKAERAARQAEAQRQLEESEAEASREAFARSLVSGEWLQPSEILELLVVGILFNDELEPAKLAGLVGFRLTERCTCGGVVTQMAEGPEQCSKCGPKVRPEPSPEPARQMQQILTRARTTPKGINRLALALGLVLTDHPYATEGYEPLPAAFYYFAIEHGYQLLPADARALAAARAALPHADTPAPAPVDQAEAPPAPDPEVDAAALKKVAIAHAKVVDCPQCGSPVSADLLEGYATASNRRPGTTCPECPPPTADARKRKVAEELADAVPSEMLL